PQSPHPPPPRPPAPETHASPECFPASARSDPPTPPVAQHGSVRQNNTPPHLPAPSPPGTELILPWLSSAFSPAPPTPHPLPTMIAIPSAAAPNSCHTPFGSAGK